MQPIPLLEIATRAEAGFCMQQTRDSVRLSRAIMCMHHMLVPELCNREFLLRIGFIRQVQRLGGRGCNIFVPVLGGNGTKIAPTGDIFDQPPGQMR